jgi:hypothetical protein
MNKRLLTGIVIGVVALGLIGYDIFAYYNGDSSTISEVIWSVCGKMPLIPFAVGILCGHLFWQSKY